MSELGLEGGDLGCQLGNVFISGHGEVIALGVLRLKLSSTVRVCLRPGTCYILVSRSAPGCVTRHTRHASVTHFRPISGNIVEVTLMTPPIMYINSHTKETYFP